MTRVVIGVADQTLSYNLRSALSEMPEVEAVYCTESTTELVSAVAQIDPDLVVVHDQLGPAMPLQAIRDLSLRRPACAALLIATQASAEQLTAAMEAGARGVVAYPLSFEDLHARVTAAIEWSQQMRRLLTVAPARGADGPGGRARVITFVGAKGGVGTTTVATHLALDVVRSVPGHRVCLIDLDLEKGDVTGLLMVRHRASVADVAKVADDLSSRAVADAVVAHESGLHLLLAPLDLHDVEAVTPRALREVVALLRQDYDLVIIDAGSHVTPAQAAVVELGDEVVAVITPDVVAVRGLRRSITMWEQLAVRKEGDIRVLVNRVARATSVSADMVRQLTKAPVIAAGLPAMFRRLEPALNQRDPFLVRESVWWRSLRLVGQEIGVVQGQPAVPAEAASSTSPRGGRSRGRTRRHDAGSASLELVGIFPTLLVAALLAWQMALYGMSFVWSGHAASVAARAQSVGADPQAAARAGLPDSVADGVTVSTPSPNRVTVRIRVPLVAPRLGSLPVTVTSSREVVREP